MRIAVIGAGAVGGTIAALLDRAGHDVEVTARGENLKAIQSTGLSLEGAWGSHVAKPEANELISRTPEIAFLATKALDARAALRDNASMLDRVPIVVVQNGLEGLDLANHELPNSVAIGALAMFAASYLRPGCVAVTTPGSTYLGNYENDQEVDRITQILRDVLPVHQSKNFLGAQWTKLLVNQINALPAITGLSAQDTISNSQLRKILTKSMKEAAKVGMKSGVKFASVEKFSDSLVRIFAAMPDWIAQLLPLFMRRKMGARPNPGSTLQSIRKGQASEIDYLNGAIVKTAIANGGFAPINAELVKLVHEVESSGEFFEPTEVSARIHAALNT